MVMQCDAIRCNACQDACTRYSHECHIGVFYSILQGDVMEEVYDGWVTTQVALMEQFSKADTANKVHYLYY